MASKVKEEPTAVPVPAETLISPTEKKTLGPQRELGEPAPSLMARDIRTLEELQDK